MSKTVNFDNITDKNFEDVKELDVIMAECAQYKIMIDEAKAHLEMIKDQVKEYMNKKNLKKLTGTEHIFTLTDTCSTSWDKKPLLEKYPDAEMFIKTSSYQRLNIK